jgi:hypothetical protein
MDAGGFQCSSSETVCASINDIATQREYINTCDAYLMAHATTADGAACR